MDCAQPRPPAQTGAVAAMRGRTVLFAFIAAATALVSVAGVRAQNESSWYPLKADDGSDVVNYHVPVELESQIEELPGIVIAGNPHGDVTLVEFYDLNCPFCRTAAPEIATLVKSDDELKLVLVPFPVRGVPSIQAGRVELALARLATPKQFYEFHHRIYEGRGVVDATRALAIAKEMGFPSDQLTKAADDEAVTKAMIAHVRLGNSMGLGATPAFVIKGAAILGYPGGKALAEIVRSIRTCDKVAC
jgi:protein-disulfide isomerase